MNKRLKKKTKKIQNKKAETQLKLVKLLSDDLAETLVLFSDGEMSKEEAAEIASQTMTRININNAAFGHKGVRWLASLILKSQSNSGLRTTEGKLTKSEIESVHSMAEFPLPT